MPELLNSYEKKVYSGWCLCGHHMDTHHISCVVNPQSPAALAGEFRLPGTCLAYGHNEDEGYDEKRREHCFGYVDRDDPNEERRKSWTGTKRRPKRRS